MREKRENKKRKGEEERKKKESRKDTPRKLNQGENKEKRRKKREKKKERTHRGRKENCTARNEILRSYHPNEDTVWEAIPTPEDTDIQLSQSTQSSNLACGDEGKEEQMEIDGLGNESAPKSPQENTPEIGPLTC